MPFSLNDILEYISHGHAYAKHVDGLGQQGEVMEGVNSFRDIDTSASPLSQASGRPQSLGPSLHINNPADLKDYMQRMIDAPSTQGFVMGRDRNIIHLFNSRDNTYMVINTLDRDFGTISRYPNSKDNFNANLTKAQRNGELYTRFDNSQTRGAAMDQIDNLIQRTKNPIALKEAPGAAVSRQAIYAGSNHLSNAPMSADYQKFAAHLDDMAAIRQGLDFSSGYVAALDDKGRPAQMFLLDESTNTVTEINGRSVTVHSFETIPEAQRAEVAQQFFDINRPLNQEVVQGGYTEVVKSFQNQNNGKLPLAGGTTKSLMTNIESGAVETFAETPYRSLGDASRAYIGFTDDQARLFDLIPAEISAERLKQIEDPAVRAALGDLTTAKGYAQIGEGDEVVEGLRMFAETLDGLDEATRAGVLDVAAAAKSPAADIARGSAAAIDALDGASDLAKMVSSIKAGRLGLNVTKAGIITTVAATTLAVSATAYANTVIGDIADQLHASGDLTDEAYSDFKAMMDDVGPMLTGQAADPFITAIPGMAIVERIAYNRFQEFSDKHQLPQNIHEMLSPSIVAGTSLRGEIGQDTFRMIPSDPAQVANPLISLVNARNAQVAANESYWDTYQANRPPVWQAALMDSGMGMHGGFGKPPSQQITEMAPDVIAAQEVLDAAKTNFQSEFDRVLADPDGARALANLMDKDQLFEIVKQTAKYNVEGQHPLIQDYVEAQSADAEWYDLRGAWNNWRARDNAEEALRDNPDVMRDYLSGIFVPERASEPTLKIEGEPVGMISPVDRVRLEQDPNFIMVAGVFEREAEGGVIDQYDQAQIQDFVDNATTIDQMSIVSMLQERYPSQMDEFLQTSANDSDGASGPDLATPDATFGTIMTGTRL